MFCSAEFSFIAVKLGASRAWLGSFSFSPVHVKVAKLHTSLKRGVIGSGFVGVVVEVPWNMNVKLQSAEVCDLQFPYEPCNGGLKGW